MWGKAIVSAGTRAACATAFLTTSHVLGSRAWTPTWKYDPRRTGWRIDMRAFDAFIDPRWARKRHQGPLDGTLRLPDAQLRISIGDSFDHRGRTRVNDYTRLCFRFPLFLRLSWLLKKHHHPAKSSKPSPSQFIFCRYLWDTSGEVGIIQASHTDGSLLEHRNV